MNFIARPQHGASTPVETGAPGRAPLRVLEVLEPSGGGSGRHFLDLCRGLKARGHHVEAVYAPYRAEMGFLRELKSIGLSAAYSVDMRRAPGLSDISAFRALRRIIDSSPPFDIIHGHSSKAGALTRLRLPGAHVPRIYTPHAFRTMDPTLGRLGRTIYGTIEAGLGRFFSDHIICVSQDEHAHALALGIPASKLSIIVNGSDAPAPDMAQTIRASFGIPTNAFVFGFIGRLSPQKAPERLIDAFRSAASRLPGAHLLMVGAGELEEICRTAIAGSGLSDRIHLTSAFTGPQAVCAFDILVMPSRYEAMSYVMLEAAAAAKPILSTDVGGAATVIDQSQNGLIVPNEDDTSQLSAAMIRCADPQTHDAMRHAAAMRVSRYTLETMLDRTEALYQWLAKRDHRFSPILSAPGLALQGQTD